MGNFPISTSITVEFWTKIISAQNQNWVGKHTAGGGNILLIGHYGSIANMSFIFSCSLVFINFFLYL